jgi:hypothetical protein
MNHVVLTDTMKEELYVDVALALSAYGSSEKAKVV